MAIPVTGNGHRSGEVMIEVDRLTRYYGLWPALRDVSFRAYRGEIVGFLGPNGAGKTTTMRVLTGFLPPSAGTARVAGFDVVDESMQARRATGYLPENTPLYTDMTVAGFLDFVARLRGVAERGAAIDRVMDRVGIASRADDLIGQLSKGLKQRVGIAQALVHDPEVIILDEPTIGLDPTQSVEVRGLIRELGGDHTILLSTHMLPEAEAICDRILIIKRGRIAADDALEQLAAQARHGGERVRLVVPGDIDPASVTKTLGGAKDVAEVSVEGDGVFTVLTSRAVDARAALAAAVVGRGWPLLELTPQRLTLEDIYLQVIARDEDEDEDLTGEDFDEAVVEEDLDAATEPGDEAGASGDGGKEA
jgi:ABC-2 type transport system ATP-binding protein